MIIGIFQCGNLCTGISSISLALRIVPQSTGVNPRYLIIVLTFSLAEISSPAYKTSLVPVKVWKREKYSLGYFILQKWQFNEKCFFILNPYLASHHFLEHMQTKH